MVSLLVSLGDRTQSNSVQRGRAVLHVLPLEKTRETSRSQKNSCLASTLWNRLRTCRSRMPIERARRWRSECTSGNRHRATRVRVVRGWYRLDNSLMRGGSNAPVCEADTRSAIPQRTPRSARHAASRESGAFCGRGLSALRGGRWHARMSRAACRAPPSLHHAPTEADVAGPQTGSSGPPRDPLLPGRPLHIPLLVSTAERQAAKEAPV